MERIPANDTLTITGEMLTRAPANLKGQLAASPEGYLFVAARPGHGPDAPGVGDVRIRYKVAKPQVISLAAKQTQATFEPFTPQAGEPVDLLKPGSHGAQALFEGAQSSIRLVGWAARVLSVLVMAVGLFLVIRLWKNVGRAATGGGLYDFGLAFLALGFAIPLVVVIVGSRWVTHQPVLGSGLLGGGLVAALGLFLVARRKPKRAVKATVDVEDSYTKAPAQAEMHALINRAIELGAPVYNGGDPAACYEIYAATARSIIKGPRWIMPPTNACGGHWTNAGNLLIPTRRRGPCVMLSTPFWPASRRTRLATKISSWKGAARRQLVRTSPCRSSRMRQPAQRRPVGCSREAW